MNSDSFKRCLENGKGVAAVFNKKEKQVLINVWKLKDVFILTWEECPRGEQFDESSYTRDDRHEFDSVDDVCKFLEKESVGFATFKPC